MWRTFLLSGGAVVVLSAAAGAQQYDPAAAARQRAAIQSASAIGQALNGQGAAPADVAAAKSTVQTGPDSVACTTDGLVHAEGNSAIIGRMTRTVAIAEKGVQMRDAARLVLPCGFISTSVRAGT